MSDLISRQAAIETVRKAKSIGQAHRMLAQLPSAQPVEDIRAMCGECDAWNQYKNPQPGWIPTSVRLPEDAYPVIVTWKNNDPKSYYQYILGKHYTGVAHFKNGIWYWYSSTTEDVLMEYGRCDSEEFDEAIQVLAWQPLPKPWEGDANG